MSAIALPFSFSNAELEHVPLVCFHENGNSTGFCSRARCFDGWECNLNLGQLKQKEIWRKQVNSRLHWIALDALMPYRFPDRTAETRSSSSAVGVQPDTSWELGFIEFVSSILIDTTFSDWYRIGGSFKTNVAAVSLVIRQTWQPSWCWNLLTTLYWVLRDGKSYLWKKPWELSFRTFEGNIRIKNNLLC